MSKQKAEHDLITYAAKKIVEMEKMTGKSVKMLDFVMDEANIRIDGQVRQETKNKVSVLFFDPLHTDKGIHHTFFCGVDGDGNNLLSKKDFPNPVASRDTSSSIY